MNLDIDYSKIKDYPEYKLFFLSDECNIQLFTHNEAMKLRDLNDEERKIMLDNSIKIRKIRLEVSKILKERFNFEILDEKGNFTKKYNEWFDKWNDWRFSFSDEKWLEIDEKLKNNESIEDYL
jgi:hypothetical protein